MSLRESCLSYRVDATMNERSEEIRRDVYARLVNRRSAFLAALVAFVLLLVPGSSPPLSAGAARSPAALAAASASGTPAAGGMLAAASSAASSSATIGAQAGDARSDRGLYYSAYKVGKGDTLSGIADAFNVSLDTVVSFNGIRNARSLQPGSYLKVPSMSGILYTVKPGDSAASVAAANRISAERIVEANGLASGELQAGDRVFLPDARLASFTLREISGDLFSWPARGWISSWYGWRSDPFSGARSFHNGLDIGVDLGTPVRAAMDGVVTDTGYNSGLGNYVVLGHHAGWTSVYGHLQSISIKPGQTVSAGQRIAFSGNTGYSTGPHLHFTVIKRGRTVNPANVLH
jgi:murein DD-endopeptidase MepM/ murein hydrolase activator NlpD